MTTTSRPTIRTISTALMLFLLAASAGCGNSAKLTEPAGGYSAFVSALSSRDAGKVWITLCDDTRQLFIDAHATLVAMDDMVARLQPSDQIEARELSGVAILERISSPQELFEYVFYQENVPVESRYATGLRIREINESGSHAEVHTRGGQVIEMVRDEDGYWRVRSPLHELFAENFAVIEENRANLETAITLFGAASDEDAEIARLLGIAPTGDAENAPPENAPPE